MRTVVNYHMQRGTVYGMHCTHLFNMRPCIYEKMGHLAKSMEMPFFVLSDSSVHTTFRQLSHFLKYGHIYVYIYIYITVYILGNF